MKTPVVEPLVYVHVPYNVLAAPTLNNATQSRVCVLLSVGADQLRVIVEPTVVVAGEATMVYVVVAVVVPVPPPPVVVPVDVAALFTDMTYV